jgi:peptidoglycan/LPS O-acetylase OafA/YrhL
LVTATSNEQKIGYLDGWRGMAILLVLVGHFFPVPGIDLGRLGVDWFFVLSGLLMGRLLFVRNTPIPLFYQRRITRIFPLFYTFLALSLIWAFVRSKEINRDAIISSALFFRNYVWVGPQTGDIPNGHLWSLAVEEQAYVLLSLVALLVRSMRVKAAPVLAAIALLSAGAIVVYQFVLGDGEALHIASLHGEYAGFGIFISALALLGARPIRAANWAVPMLIVGGSLLHWWSVPLAIQSIVGVGCLAVAINLLETGPNWVRSALNFAPLRTLGVWSYSIYIWQQVFYASTLGRPIAAIGAMVVSIVSFYCIEQPARLWLNRVWATEKESDAASPGAAFPSDL